MRRRPHACRPTVPPTDDRALERRLAALRADYHRITPDPAFVLRVHARIAALTRPLRIRRRRRALAFAASVVVAFAGGFLGARGGGFGGRGGGTPSDAGRALLAAPTGLAPSPTRAAPHGRAQRADDRAPLPPPGASDPKAAEARATADRLRALLAPLGTPAAYDAATLAAWRRATRDPDATLRAVARALLRASDGVPDAGAPSDVGPAPPPSGLHDPDIASGPDVRTVPAAARVDPLASPPAEPKARTAPVAPVAPVTPATPIAPMTPAPSSDAPKAPK